MGDETPVVDLESIVNEIPRVDRRGGGGWLEWMWLIAAFATAGFEIFAPPITEGWAKPVVSFGLPLLGLSSLVYVYRHQAVVARMAIRLQKPVTWSYVPLLVVAGMFRLIFEPTHTTLWLVILGSLPAFPCVFAAWKVWRQ